MTLVTQLLNQLLLHKLMKWVHNVQENPPQMFASGVKQPLAPMLTILLGMWIHARETMKTHSLIMNVKNSKK